MTVPDKKWPKILEIDPPHDHESTISPKVKEIHGLLVGNEGDILIYLARELWSHSGQASKIRPEVYKFLALGIRNDFDLHAVYGELRGEYESAPE